MEFKNNEVNIDFFWRGCRVNKNRNDFVSTGIRLPLHSCKLCSYSIKIEYVETKFSICNQATWLYSKMGVLYICPTVQISFEL